MKVHRKHVNRLKLEMLTRGLTYIIDVLHTQILESDRLARRTIEMARNTTSLLDNVIR